MELLRLMFSILFDSNYYKKKELSCKKVTWMDFIFPPVFKAALIIGLILGILKLIIF
jgi:hypothetical protein